MISHQQNNSGRRAAGGTFFAVVSALLLAMSASGATPAESASLAGTWRFALDRANAGVTEKWFARNLDGTIQLPGVLQAQGFGDAISTATPWVLSLYDRNWFLRADYLAHARPGNVKVPFVCQPPRHDLGASRCRQDSHHADSHAGDA